MSDPQRPSILSQATKQTENIAADLAEDEKARIAVTSDSDTPIRVGGAVDLGKGFAAGGHVEKTPTGWGWFVGGVKRWFKTPASRS